jgi:hypothetical protein
MMTATNPYKEPILTIIFRLLGMLFAILAVGSLIVGIVIIATGQGSSQTVFLQVFPAFAITMLFAVIYFGVGQAIDFLGKTAHATTHMAQSQDAKLASIVDRLQAIRNRLEQGAPFKVEGVDPVAGTAPGPDDLIFSYLNSDGIQEGPVSQNDLVLFLETGLITPETLVLRDGQADWSPCHHHVQES